MLPMDTDDNPAIDRCVKALEAKFDGRDGGYVMWSEIVQVVIDTLRADAPVASAEEG